MAYRCNMSANNYCFQYDPIYRQYKHQCNVLGFYSKTCRYDLSEVRDIFSHQRRLFRFSSVKNDQIEDMIDTLKSIENISRLYLDIQSATQSSGNSDNGSPTEPSRSADHQLTRLVEQLNFTALNYSQSSTLVLSELTEELKKLREANRVQAEQLKKSQQESVDEIKKLRSDVLELKNNLVDMSTSFASSLGTNLSESNYSFFETQFPAIMKNAFLEALQEANISEK
ncbi:hypothetical protein HDE_02072 [Halotydeus destructor]|nr:hypothetical protein HDE_02072 [Halotydeus destructor]